MRKVELQGTRPLCPVSWCFYEVKEVCELSCTDLDDVGDRLGIEQRGHTGDEVLELHRRRRQHVAVAYNRENGNKRVR